MPVQVHFLYFVSILVAWVLVYHVTYWSLAILRDRSLICWSVGPLGMSVVALREPPIRQVLAQLGGAAAAVAVVAYASLYLVHPSPIVGLSQTGAAEAFAVALPVIAISLWRLIGIVRERRLPVWGEARVLAGVQRSIATGAHLYFTPNGRDFLYQRFGATPGEFMNMVRL